MASVVVCVAPHSAGRYLQVQYSSIVSSVSLWVMCRICERFCGPWTGWCPADGRLGCMCVVNMAALTIHCAVF